MLALISFSFSTGTGTLNCVAYLGVNMSKSERRPTMVHVARLAGLSHQTVSECLNNQPGVLPETRERVLAAIDELGYRRNGFARALVTSRTRLLGVVVYGASWYGPAGTLHGIQQAARDARYFVTVVDLDKITHGDVKRALDVLTEYSPDGIVVITLKRSVSDELQEMALGIPTIAVEGGQGTPDLPVVCVDQEAARVSRQNTYSPSTTLTVHHLAGPVDWLEAEARMRGWRSCLEAAGASPPPAVRGDWTSRSGYEAGVKLLKQSDVTAVFAANDQMAFGLLMACRETGLEGSRGH